MKLHIQKRQSKGLLGKVKLEITSRVELTEEEEKLIRKYKSGGDTLCHGTFKGIDFNITVDKILKESTSKHSNIEDLKFDEGVINDSYDALKEKIEMLKEFENETSTLPQTS